MSKFKKLTEFVLLGDSKYGYNFPDDISKEQGKALSDTIDASEELIRLVNSEEATAADIWNILGNTSVGAALIKANPNITKFRISGERKDKDAFEQNAYNQQVPDDKMSTTPMHRYDVASQRFYRAGKTTPSFRHFFNPANASEYRAQEVSGAAPRERKLEPKKTM